MLKIKSKIIVAPKPILKNKGMSFIEVLIALVILVTGILGAAAMQASAKKASFDAYQRSIASALTQDIIEKMRNNDPGSLSLYEGNYGADAAAVPGVICNSPGVLCTTPAQVRANDIFEWSQALRGANTMNNGNRAGSLIDAIGCIAVENQKVTVMVSWQGRVATTDGAANNGLVAAECGAEGDSRRQVMIDVFII
jgi:type IV pilus assembly protein PilV